MAVIGICTRWWGAECMRCGATWGPFLHDPLDEPFCYLCGVHAIVTEEGSEPGAVTVLLRMQDKDA